MDDEFILVTCPACKKRLPMEVGRREMFCAYCGERVPGPVPDVPDTNPVTLLPAVRGELGAAQMIRLPLTLFFHQDKHCKAIRQKFLKLGFSNVTYEPMHDLFFGILEKPGNVQSVTVDGKLLLMMLGRDVPASAKIVIHHHSYFRFKKGGSV